MNNLGVGEQEHSLLAFKPSPFQQLLHVISPLSPSVPTVCSHCWILFICCYKDYMLVVTRWCAWQSLYQYTHLPPYMAINIPTYQRIHREA